MEQEHLIRWEKLVHGGQALGHDNGETYFGWNALPGETTTCRNVRRKKGIVECIADEIIIPSPDRMQPRQPHFLSSSPWDILRYEAELAWKVRIAQESFAKLAKANLSQLEIITDNTQYGYRNKMEYGFYVDDANGRIYLSLFERAGRRPVPLPKGDALAQDELNKTALEVVKWVNKQGFKKSELKTLIVRSNRKGETIAGIFVKNKKLSYKNLPKLNNKCRGFAVYYSTHKSPASVITDVIETTGELELTETILDAPLKFGLMSFFQVNPTVFELSLIKMKHYIPDRADVVDFYSGVGAISIPLHDHIGKAHLVESSNEATEYATQNIFDNNLSDYTATHAPSENMLDAISADRLIIFDPPRAGLHKDVVQRVLDVQPPRIIYLSCNVATQARDINMLKSQYDIIDAELYNYFPRTPHFESLLILDRK